MAEQLDNETLQQELEAKLTPKNLEVVAEQLGKIFTEPLGDDLIRFVPEGTAKNWQRAIELADIVFDSPSRTLDQADKKPWQYQIDVVADNETQTLNARMVGQVIQSLSALAELHRQDLPPEDKSLLLSDASEAVKNHFQTTIWKHAREITQLSSGKSVKSAAEQSGVTFAQGIDAASPTELLHILKTIEERAAAKPNIEKNNQLIKIRVLRPKTT